MARVHISDEVLVYRICHKRVSQHNRTDLSAELRRKLLVVGWPDGGSYRRDQNSDHCGLIVNEVQTSVNNDIYQRWKFASFFNVTEL